MNRNGWHCALPDHVSAWMPHPAPMPAPMVGYVSSSEYDKMSAAVVQMSADVNAAAKSENEVFAATFSMSVAMKACFAAGLQWDPGKNQCLQQPMTADKDLTANGYGGAGYVGRPVTKWRVERWTPFVTKWNDHAFNDWTSDAFHGLVQEYNALRAEWAGLGQVTNAPPVKYESSVADKILEGAGDAGKNVAGAATYGLATVAMVALVAAAVVYGGPVIVRLLAARR